MKLRRKIREDEGGKWISSGYMPPTQEYPTRNVGRWKGKKITSRIARALKKRKAQKDDPSRLVGAVHT